MAGLGYVSMRRQPNSTCCWITSAEFCLRALGKPKPSVDNLISLYQVTDATSASAMDGAGNPKTILEAYGAVCDLQQGDVSLLPRIAAETAAGRPVIAGLRAPAISGFGHAVVIVGATRNGVTLGFKDPAQKQPDHVTYVTGKSFIEGFKYANAFYMDIYCYASRIIFIT